MLKTRLSAGVVLAGVVGALLCIAPAANAAPAHSAAAAANYCDRGYAYANNGTYYRYPIKQMATGDETNCILERGVTSNGVKTLQITLNQCYGKGLVVDGVFGNGTYNALLQVQRQAGTTIDGVYGPQTRRAILWAGDNGTCARIPF